MDHTPRVTRSSRGPKGLVVALTWAGWLVSAVAADLRITGWRQDGSIAWGNAPVPGVVSLEVSAAPSGPWLPDRNAFATNATGSLRAAPSPASSYRRLWAVDLPPTRVGFEHLVSAYGLLETVAGDGAGQTDGVSYWQEWYEDWPATWASLSRPHFAMADDSGNIFIVDKNSHSVLRVSADGLIHTHAGTHLAGFNGEGPAPARELALNFPNGLWVRGDGTVYVLDTENGRVRRVSTNGVMQTLLVATGDGSALRGGRGLWVAPDESLVYFGAETRVRAWSPGGGVRTVASGFTDLGLLYPEPNGDLLVCDRGAHRAYRVRPDGTKTVFAGNGKTDGGGDGFPALSTGLAGLRGIWPMPTGGYLLLTHDGCQLWYLDTAGTVHLLLNGAGGRTHAGDGGHFYAPEPRISEGRSVTIDRDGNILVCESDYGFVRRIRFQRLAGTD